MQPPNDDNAKPMTTEAAEPHGVPTGRMMHVVYVCALAAAVMGMYFSIRYDPMPATAPPVPSSGSADQHADPGVQPSMTYAQVGKRDLGPNAHWRSVLPAQRSIDYLWEHAHAGSPQGKIDALSDMASRRAYHGAPPTIPHNVDPVEHISCIRCHGPNGMRLGDEVVASPMPHAHYANCTQCHVAQQKLEENEIRWLDNDFVGLAEPTAGQRAWPSAPPTIPHATNMRANCVSCHGPNGESGLRSSHPWRTSCTQCHAPSGQLNQQPGADVYDQLFLPNNLPNKDD